MEIYNQIIQKITLYVLVIFIGTFQVNAQRIGDPGWSFDTAKKDSDYPKMERWSDVGVRGGIPLRNSLSIVENVSPGNNLQNAIDRVSSRGGGVVFLEQGTHTVNKEIRMKSKVVLRGVSNGGSIVKVTLRGTNDKYAIIFDKVTNAGLEDLKFTFPVANATPQDDRNNPTNRWCRSCHENDPNDVKDLYVTFVRIENDASDNWIDNCEFIEAGTNPIKVDGNYNTFRDNLVDGCYNKGGGGEGYYDVRGHDNLFYNETVKRIRHFAIQQGADHNVVFGCTFVNTDINFHNKDDGNNLIEKNNITIQRWRSWGAFATGGAQFGHKPPGPNNILYDNNTDVKGTQGEFAGSDKVYVFDDFGTPDLLRSKRPKGGTLYAVKHQGGDAGNDNQSPLLSFNTLKDGDQFDAGASLKPVVNASDSDGSIANVKLYLNGNLIRQESFAPYEWGHLDNTDQELKNLTAGDYILKAEAQDDDNATASIEIKITVKNPNVVPTLTFSVLKDGDQFDVGASLKPVVNASDSDGSIANVKLYLNGNLVRQESFAPYEWGHLDNRDQELKNLTSGTYILKAVVEDNKGAKSEKKINIIIEDVSALGRQQINGEYTIKNKTNSENIIAPSWDNFNVRTHSSVTIYRDHRWEFRHLGNGKHTIKNIGTGRYLQVSTTGCANRQNIATSTNANANHQQWYVEKKENDYFLIPTHCENYALDKNSGNAANVHLWSKSLNNKNQQFDLIPVSNTRNKTKAGTPMIGVVSDISQEFTIFPNPVISGAMLSLHSFMGQKVACTIFSASIGSKVTTYSFNKEHDDTVYLDLDNLAVGLYIIRLKTEDNQEFTRRFLIKR